jgi:ketosteroid isomerase-like protein
MYHAIVRAKLRRAFRQINAGRYDPIVAQFAEPHVHVMHGEHAMSGERRSIASTARWYARLQRLMPDLRFEIEHIAVAGWPWRTVAFVAWTDQFTLPDGTRTANQGVHVFGLRWGKVHSLAVHCDTARLEGLLRRAAALGLGEAIAPPIDDGLAAAPSRVAREATMSLHA